MMNLQTKRKANTDGCSHFSKGSLLRVPPALTEEEWDVPTSSPFQKGLQDTRKLRCSSIQLDFVATEKLAEHQAKAYDFECLFWVPSNLFPLQELYPPGN